jgi:hypothetical protein
MAGVRSGSGLRVFGFSRDRLSFDIRLAIFAILTSSWVEVERACIIAARDYFERREDNGR